MVRLQSLTVEVYVDLSLHPSFIQDGTHARHAFKGISDLLIHNPVNIGTAFLCRYRNHKHWDHGAAELKDKRFFGLIGDIWLRKVDFLPNVVDSHIQLRAPVEYAVNDGYVVL